MDGRGIKAAGFVYCPEGGRMNIWAIGDIHGEAQKLKHLIALLNDHYDLDLSRDKIIFLGDYIDRGPDSYNVLALIHALCEEFPNNVVALAGNHEHLMIEHHIQQWDGLWYMNGGKATERSFYKHHGSKKCPGKLLRWLNDLPLSHEEPGFFFSHAPQFKDEFRYSEGAFTPEELTWTYHKDYVERSRVFPHGMVGVCGHIHDLFNNNPHPRLYDNYIFADAGCGCSKDAPLCAIEVQTRKIVYSI